jgi:hypothetical protein
MHNNCENIYIYHLKTGGVITVLKQQVEAVRDKCEVLVLSGEPPDISFPAYSLHTPNFLKILKLLQKKGIKLFLQIYDFAEDGRSLYYFSEEYVSHCHICLFSARTKTRNFFQVQGRRKF